MTRNEKERLLIAIGLQEFMRLILRREYGSMKEAAKAIGCSQSYISQILSGAKQPSKKVLAACGMEMKVRVTYEVVS